MTTTQQHLPIKDIKEDILILKDGSMAMVLETSAVNFDLLSENEQLAIIESFAQFLNSLSFVIQIVIHSKRLDISSYLSKLAEARQNQKNPLLRQIMQRYESFVATTIRENEVLDKQFFIVIPVSFFEVGLTPDTDKNLAKIKTLLLPRRDHIVKQLSRIGLKGIQLNNEKLTNLYYEIFNESMVNEKTEGLEQTTNANINKAPVVSKIDPIIISAIKNPVQITPVQPVPEVAILPIQTQLPTQPKVTASIAPLHNPARLNSHTPFVVEELGDDYGYV